MSWVGAVTALAKNPRQVAKDKDIEKQLEKLARKLVTALKA